MAEVANGSARQSPQVFRLTWRAARGPFAGALLVAVLRAAVATASAVVLARLVTQVLAIPSTGSGARMPQEIWSTLLFASGLLAAQEPLAQALAHLSNRVTWLVTDQADRQLMDLILAPPGLAHLEDPGFVSDVETIRGSMAAVTMGAASKGMIASAFGLVTSVFGVGLLASYVWWAPVVPITAACVSFLAVRRTFIHLYVGWRADAGELRRAGYWRSLALTPRPAMELRIFGLGSWLRGRQRTSWLGAMRPIWKQRSGVAWRLVGAGLVVGAAWAVIAAVLARQVILDGAEVGVVIGGTAAVSMILSGGSYGNDQTFGWHAGQNLRDLQRLRDRRLPAVVTGELQAPNGINEPIVFEHVRFRYPNTDQNVLTDLNLTIDPGTSLGIVGMNGAGKTTLLKLLTRMYDIDGGSIRIGPIDLRDLDPDSWRRNTSFVCQDFVRYELSLRDNVAFGATPRPGDDAVVGAIRRMGVGELVDGNLGLDTPLSRRFAGGIELSGGQWQRIAIARALVNAAPNRLLILDEPTAQLDVDAEAAFFDDFLDLTSGATTIVVSHRFSTVRRADRIVVLDRGGIIEDGTHEELLVLDGAYAEAFHLQARGLTRDPEPDHDH